jgi:hypothetical protein
MGGVCCVQPVKERERKREREVDGGYIELYSAWLCMPIKITGAVYLVV